MRGKTEHRRNWTRTRMKNSISLQLAHAISSGMRHSLRQNNISKDRQSWEDLVDFTLDQLKTHLESKFRDGMNWSNRGRGGWHIDHIRPISSFNITSKYCEDFKKCWALENLQPLWEHENLSKSDKWEPSTCADASTGQTNI